MSAAHDHPDKTQRVATPTTPATPTTSGTPVRRSARARRTTAEAQSERDNERLPAATSETTSGGGGATSGGGVPTIELLRRVRSGELSPDVLDAEARRACVECLLVEGRTVAEIAVILRVSDRTVTRDKARLQTDNAARWEPGFVEAHVGMLQRCAEQARSGFLRVARDAACSHGSRIKAERAAWRVIIDLTASLQSLGWLPTAPRRVQADLTHRQELSAEALAEEMETVFRVYSEARPDDRRGAVAMKRLTRRVARLAPGDGCDEDGCEGDEDGRDDGDDVDA